MEHQRGEEEDASHWHLEQDTIPGLHQLVMVSEKSDLLFELSLTQALSSQSDTGSKQSLDCAKAKTGAGEFLPLAWTATTAAGRKYYNKYMGIWQVAQGCIAFGEIFSIAPEKWKHILHILQSGK